MLRILSCFSLLKALMYSSNCQSVVQILRNDWLSSPLICLCLVILVPLHSKCLSRPRLPISKDSCMEPIDDFANQSWCLQPIEDIFLGCILVNDLVKRKCLPDQFRVVISVICTYRDLPLFGIHFKSLLGVARVPFSLE